MLTDPSRPQDHDDSAALRMQVRRLDADLPLPRYASRGDQILNAGYFSRKGYAMELNQEQLTPETLITALKELYDSRISFVSRMSADAAADGTDGVMAVIQAVSR